VAPHAVVGVAGAPGVTAAAGVAWSWQKAQVCVVAAET
jgi:hypothetical protein